MAVQFPSTLGYGEKSLTKGTLYFRRKKTEVRTKKIQRRKQKLRFKHIMGMFILFSIMFLGLQQFWLFLISWDNLRVTRIEVRCSLTELQQGFEKALKNQDLGNLLLLDLKNLQKAISSHNWVKTVQTRKILPSSLVIDIIPRTPSAVLEKNGSHYLIDQDGIFLKKIEPGQEAELPALIDKNNFQKDYLQKLSLAWQCLNELPSETVSNISLMDLSLFRNISIKLKESETWIHLGNTGFKEKMEFLHREQESLKNFQPLEYIDLRISGRLYFMPGKETNSSRLAGSAEEDNNA